MSIFFPKAQYPKFNITNVFDKGEIIVCLYKNLTRTQEFFRAEDPLFQTLPLFVVDLAVILLVTRLLLILLKPLHQPRFVAHLLSGIIMGPSVLGKSSDFAGTLFPFKALVTLETLANLGLSYYMFFIGLETDLKPIKRAGRKPISIAIVGIAIASPIGFTLHHILQPKIPRGIDPTNYVRGAILWANVLGCSQFPEIANIITHLKLLHSDLGQTALTSALISDFCSWIFLILTMVVAPFGGGFVAVASILAFILFCFIAVHPLLSWVIDATTTPDDEYIDKQIQCVLLGVLIWGFLTDAFGAHSITGAYLLGVIMPKGNLKNALIGNMEYFINEIMMPLFFCVVGLRANMRTYVTENGTGWDTILTVVTLAPMAKILSTFLASALCKIPLREALSLGVLMNTKGILALIILNYGRDTQALDKQTFSTLLMACVIMSTTAGPCLAALQMLARGTQQNKRRSIQSVKPNTPFRILACIHTKRHVKNMINFLLDASNPTRGFPIWVFAVELVELEKRATTKLILQNTYKSQDSINEKTSGEDIDDALERFKSQNHEAIILEKQKVMSSYSDMHENICMVADDKFADLILIPFNKQASDEADSNSVAVSSRSDDANNSVFRAMNQNLLDNAPCSVGIFVDRGLDECTRRGSGRKNFAMLFVGGPDDREALAYASRISGHSDASLTVIRFVPGLDAQDFDPIDSLGDNYDGIRSAILTSEQEKRLDEDYILKFKVETASNGYAQYVEEVVNSTEETLEVLFSLGNDYSLYIVGKKQKVMSPATSGLVLTECPELGPLGDTLVSASFAANTSILIIQQHAGEVEREDLAFFEGPGRLKEQHGHMTWQASVYKTSNYEPFVHRKGRGPNDYY
ncbi:Cation/H(+) antiporter like [Quillaja saponaria]|uniref:Cation/H(+) antiporter like n=1 Tax=Quillaja saponaria TaxID=32244 RepID=A0AAD7L086_QUISA|nr:Cation/H(+) antiporter like [Quillaja saponaria]